MMLNKNKKSMTLSIVLLVMATLVLVITALAVFSYRDAKISESILSGTGAEKVYVQAEILNFYLRTISKNIESEENPVLDFKKEFYEYRLQDGKFIFPELAQIEPQINSEHIQVKNKEVSVNFAVSIEQAFEKGYASYNYTFNFNKKLK